MKNVKEFKLIECSGTPYEIGRQWGEGCKESILKVSKKWTLHHNYSPTAIIA